MRGRDWGIRGLRRWWKGGFGMGIQDGEGGRTYDMRIRRESCKSAPQRIG